MVSVTSLFAVSVVDFCELNFHVVIVVLKYVKLKTIDVACVYGYVLSVIACNAATRATT